MNLVELSINICIALLACIIFGGLGSAILTSIIKPSHEGVLVTVVVCMTLTFVGTMWLLYAKSDIKD